MGLSRPAARGASMADPTRIDEAAQERSVCARRIAASVDVRTARRHEDVNDGEQRDQRRPEPLRLPGAARHALLCEADAVGEGEGAEHRR